MNPRLFIGSSTESLEIANALQASLDYDADVTIWNQGIFNLSSDTLGELLMALSKFDFAVFIFQPSDITIIRDQKLPTVRDNVIFELGLFLGRLGKERVFYLVDRSISDLHLPTDLLGITSGNFNGNRQDANIQAALGPFSHEIRKKFKTFVFENLTDLKDESESIKRFAMDKPAYWEFSIAVELLNSKLAPINKSFDELERDVVVQRKTPVNHKELYRFVLSSFETFQSLSEQFKTFLQELQSSFGPPGESGNALEIKSAIDHLIQICKELLAWEYDLNALIPPKGLEPVKSSMKGWSKVFVDDINTIAPQTSQMVLDDKAGLKATPIMLVLRTPAGMDTSLIEPFTKYVSENNIQGGLL
jgi:hypothetical protein